MKLRLIFIIIIVLALSGCASGSASLPAEKTHESEVKADIHIMAYNDRSTRSEYLKYISDELPLINIVYEYVSLEHFNNELNVRLLAGQGPDIIEVGGEARILASTNHLLDLTNEGFINKYMKEGLDPFSVRNRVYAIPLQSWFEGIFYNKAIFEQHHLSLPKTLDEFIRIHIYFPDYNVKAYPDMIEYGIQYPFSKTKAEWGNIEKTLIAELYAQENPDVAAQMAKIAEAVDGFLVTE